VAACPLVDRVHSVILVNFSIQFILYGASAGPWQEASEPARSNGPYETRSHKNSAEEVELVMCDGKMKIHPKGEREEERGAQCILNVPQQL